MSQPLPNQALIQAGQNALDAQQETQRRQAVADANALGAAEARAQTEQALAALRKPSPVVPARASTTPATGRPSSKSEPPPPMASIPDAVLAASNAAVRAAAANRR